VEIAGKDAVFVTTTGLLDVAAHQIRVVRGYYPEYEPPPLNEGTTIGLMARHDIHLVSVEHCILACAHKNVIATAHEGDMHLQAKKVMTARAGAIAASAGSVTVEAGSVDVHATGNITIKADGDITLDAAGMLTLKGGNVVVDGGTLRVVPNATMEGWLSVADDVIAAAVKGG